MNDWICNGFSAMDIDIYFTEFARSTLIMDIGLIFILQIVFDICFTDVARSRPSVEVDVLTVECKAT